VIAMNAIVIYESVYGNTRDVANAIATGLGGATVVSVADAGTVAPGSDLIVVGGPTHIHGMTTSRSRHAAVDGTHTEVERGVSDGPGVREWLHELGRLDGVRAAAFDTRAKGRKLLTGAASNGIARRLRDHGCDVIDTASFIVTGTEGPLQDGELERAQAWGARLVGAAAQPTPG
jgi:hypothetical protein